MKGVWSSWLLGWIQPCFNFTASKYVFIKDWRLGVILRLLQLACLIYVLITIFQKASYLVTEVPTGYVTVWPDGQTMETKADAFAKQGRVVREGSLEYCKNPGKYAFDWSGIVHENFECAFLDSSSLFINGESQTFLTTSMRVEKLLYYTQDASGNCMDPADVGAGFAAIQTNENVCGYTQAKGYFPILPEDISLNLLHSYRTSSVVDKKGSLPRTIVRAPGFNSKDIVIEAGSEVKLHLGELLTLAGVDLDERLDRQDNAASREESQGRRLDNGTVEYPFARLSGLTLHVSFNYYTRRLAPGKHNKPTGANADDIICLVDIVPQNKWSFLGSEIRHMMNRPDDPQFLTPGLIDDLGRGQGGASQIISSQTDFQRNGITLLFSVSGSVGRFDLTALINALVAGSVLMAIAQVVTTYVALYALGISSELYKAFMRETVDWRQEYARYAAQACVAGYAFMQYDDNKSMKLDRKEIFDVLKKLMAKKQDIEDWQLAALADFLMRQGETGTEVQKGRFNVKDMVENYIDIEEWIDIFTEDKANWPALKRLIEHEYADEESREGVLELLDKSAARKNRSYQPNESDEDIERDGTPLHQEYAFAFDANTPLIQDGSESAHVRPGRSSM